MSLNERDIRFAVGRARTSFTQNFNLRELLPQRCLIGRRREALSLGRPVKGSVFQRVGETDGTCATSRPFERPGSIQPITPQDQGAPTLGVPGERLRNRDRV